MQTAFIALGANLGDPLTTLQQARQDVGKLGEITGVSRLYRTAPVGGPPGQPDYLNAMLRLETSLPAPELLAALHTIEANAGRTRTVRWEARLLDLDLILYGAELSDLPTLTLPHPRAWERAFVLAPLADIAPTEKHPLTGETAADALARLDLAGIKISGDW